MITLKHAAVELGIESGVNPIPIERCAECQRSSLHVIRTLYSRRHEDTGPDPIDAWVIRTIER